MISTIKLKTKPSEVEAEAADNLPVSDTTAFTACFLDRLIFPVQFLNRKHLQVFFIQQKEGSFCKPSLSFCHSTHWMTQTQLSSLTPAPGSLAAGLRLSLPTQSTKTLQ